MYITNQMEKISEWTSWRKNKDIVPNAEQRETEQLWQRRETENKMRRSLIYPKEVSETEIKRQHQRIFQNEREARVIRMNKHTKSWAEWIHKSTPKHIIVTLENARERENLKSNQEDKLPIKKQRCDWQQTYHLHTQCLLLVKGHCKAVENAENGFCLKWLHTECIFFTNAFRVKCTVIQSSTGLYWAPTTCQPGQGTSQFLNSPKCWTSVSCKGCDGGNTEAPEGKGKVLTQGREVRERGQGKRLGRRKSKLRSVRWTGFSK